MSHITKIGFNIKDIDVLAEACAAIGLVFHEGRKQFKSFGERMHPCDHAISVAGNENAYEVGVLAVPSSDGSPLYDLHLDEWLGGRGLIQEIGTRANRLKREYLALATIKQLKSEGMRVSRTVAGNGETIIVAQARY